MNIGATPDLAPLAGDPTFVALDEPGLRQFADLRAQAIAAVSGRFYSEHAQVYAAFGPRGNEACRQDLGYHLDFLRPALEFGDAQPMLDYLRWLETVLQARDIPAAHLAQSVEWLADFFLAAMTPPAGPVVHGALQGVRSLYLAPRAGIGSAEPQAPPAWPECAQFTDALLAGDRGDASHLMTTCQARSGSLVDTELHLVQPALYSIGRQWQANEVTVAQEHLATALSTTMMSDGLQRSVPAAPNGRKVLLACVEGNQHSVGLQMVADAFLLDGWDVQYLGAGVPPGAIVAQATRFRPDLIGLSVSFAHQLDQVKVVMRRLAAMPGRPPVLLGGLAINQFAQLAAQLGADGWSADARSAVAQAHALVGQPQAV